MEAEDFAQEVDLEAVFQAKVRELMSPADYQYRCEVALMLHISGFTRAQIGKVIHTTPQRAGQIVAEAHRLPAMAERVGLESMGRCTTLLDSLP